MASKRIQLTEEEVRHIEQRRYNENLKALGFNTGIDSALHILGSWQGNLRQMGVDGASFESLTAEVHELKKAIRP